MVTMLETAIVVLLVVALCMVIVAMKEHPGKVLAIFWVIFFLVCIVAAALSLYLPYERGGF
jgi:hypothetical protein